jgi:putative transposase
VVMPEHFHLLVSEPAVGSPPLAMQVLKQRVSRRSRRKKKTSEQLPFWEADQQEQPPAFWQKRYYDFNVYTQRKYIEKLRYMHRNPVRAERIREGWMISLPPFARSCQPRAASAQRMGHPAMTRSGTR